jgi:hypothetical protein
VSRLKFIARIGGTIWGVAKDFEKIHLIRTLRSPLEERLGGFHRTDLLRNREGDSLAQRNAVFFRQFSSCVSQ